MADPLMTIGAGIAAGLVFGASGFLSKRDPDEEFNPRKLLRTLVIFGAAGAVVALAGDPVTEGNIIAATGSTAVLGKLVDEWYGSLTRTNRQDDPPPLSFPTVQDDGTLTIPNGPVEGNLGAEPGDRVAVVLLGTLDESDRHLFGPPAESR